MGTVEYEDSRFSILQRSYKDSHSTDRPVKVTVLLGADSDKETGLHYNRHRYYSPSSALKHNELKMDHSKSAQLTFETHVQFAPEVTECHNITGDNEYLLRVETKDLLAYKRFHSEVLGECAQVNSITTMVVMDSPKDER